MRSALWAIGTLICSLCWPITHCVNVELLKPYEHTAAQMYVAADANQDGTFTVEELMQEYSKYDVNKDGVVSRNEYTSYMCYLAPALYQLSHYLFDRFDLQPVDHKLETTDFQAFYDQLDTNNDANVDETEWSTWWIKTFQDLELAGIHVHGNSEEHGNRHCMQ